MKWVFRVRVFAFAFVSVLHDYFWHQLNGEIQHHQRHHHINGGKLIDNICLEH